MAETAHCIDDGGRDPSGRVCHCDGPFQTEPDEEHAVRVLGALIGCIGGIAGKGRSMELLGRIWRTRAEVVIGSS